MATKDTERGTVEADEESWSGPKLVLLGFVAMGIAIAILYSISPFRGVILPG